MRISKKAFSQAVMPFNNDVIEGCRVTYVKSCAMSYTACGEYLPDVGIELEWKGRKFIVDSVNPLKKQYTASFSGFVDFTVPQKPDDDEVEKLI